MSQRQSGMTLLEVLLAIFIFATCSLALLNSLHGQVSATAKMEEQVLAGWVADNVLKTYQLTADASGLSTWTADVALEDKQQIRLQRFIPSPQGGPQNVSRP